MRLDSAGTLNIAPNTLARRDPRDVGQRHDLRGTDASTPLLSLCNSFVALYKEAFGRGPTKACARYAGPDVIVVLLEKTLTVVERNLVALGQEDRLRELRHVTRNALEDQLRTIVERSTRRRTLALMTAIDPQRDVAAEVITLEPVE